jgi:hypothetical protein
MFQFRFIAMLVTPPYQALCPPPSLSLPLSLPPHTPPKDNVGCIERVLFHLCTTLLLYLISLLSTPLADFLLIDQPTGHLVV